MQFTHRTSRKFTCHILDMAENGLIDWETLSRDLLNWMSEHEVEQFARRNDYFTEVDDDA